MNETTLFIIALLSELGAIALFIIKLTGVILIPWGWVGTSFIWMPIVLLILCMLSLTIVTLISSLILAIFQRKPKEEK